MSEVIRYDESFQALATAVYEELGVEALDRGVVVRDAGGRLAFFFDGELADPRRERLANALVASLGPYARPDRVVATRQDPGAGRVFDQPEYQWIGVEGRRVACLDRRIVGVDWLAGPAPPASAPPRVAFASFKGGVGRTTALCVAATELARQGRNVLAVDLDLEAPGLGSMLLAADPRLGPRYGVLDYLVEASISGDVEGLVGEILAPSVAPSPEGGRVMVVPAFGSATVPEHYLGKLSRALLDTAADGAVWPVRAKLARMVEHLSERSPCDVVLLDARAGLAELTAGPLLGLGATVLLFGAAQVQTLSGLRLLLSALSTLIPPEGRSPWDNLRLILAKATPDEARNRWFRDEAYELFASYIYEEQEGLDGFNFDPDDPEAPHYPTPIALDVLFADWDPARRPGDLTLPFYDRAFRPFLDALGRWLEPS